VKKLLNITFAIILSLNIVACASPAKSSSTDSVAVSSDDSRTEPQLPAVYIDTSYTRPTGRTIQVSGGEAGQREFQAALNSANPGDTIALEAGAEFVGNFTLPAKAAAAKNWITIRTSTPDAKLPPAGVRVSPADSRAMPKLVSPNADPVIKTAPAAHHFRFIGVEFQVAPGVTQNFGLILLGDGGGAQNSTDKVPHDLIIDRCYIHGNQTGNLRRGIGLNSARTAVIDSYISDCREFGADSQAICGWNGPGPFKIVNNYLEGAGENFMLGGADPSIKNLVTEDVEFRGNYCSKPLSWKVGHPTFAGKRWSVKNLFELKNARRVLIEGNLFEHSWLDAQVGFAILFTPRNQEGGAPWATVEDVTFTNNVVRHAAGGINIMGRDDNHPSQQTRRITINNNLFEDLGGPKWGGNGRFLQITETDRVTLNHNTIIHTGNIITAYGKPSTNFIFTNNLMRNNDYGVMGDGASTGNATLEQYFPACVFKKNVIAGGRSSAYPSDNFFPASIDEAKFADRAGGNFSLNASSPYKNAGTDGKSIGCDVAVLKTHTGPFSDARPAQ
jgi:hypothetical protein